MVGKTLSHYEILAPLGKGGMGEVYRARDTKLERDVAIKVLPDDLAADPDRLARFEREARLLATLTHASIASIHGLEEADGVRFLVLELIEGESLERRLQRGPLPVAEALDVARQIAEALEAAHDARIIHRDVKPANVLLTAKGAVKVLDFGIAKRTLLDDDASTALTKQATSLTVDGALLGTPPYMAPEQVRGEEADKRADIWAFGCIVFEMLTGRGAFTRQTVADTLVAVLEQEPDWSSLPPDTPAPVQSVLRRCLRKDPHRRLHDVADARIELDEAAARPRTLPAGPDARRRSPGWRQAVPTIAALGLGALVTAIVAWTWWPDTSGLPGSGTVRFEHRLASGHGLIGRGAGRALAISGDGRYLAYFATVEGVRRSSGGTARALFVRHLSTGEVSRVEGIPETRVNRPFFSPDGETIGYYDANAGELQRVPIGGGRPIPITEASAPLGISWSGDSVYYGQAAGIFEVPADGDGEPVLVVPARDGEQLYGPQLLPDGESLLFTVNEGEGTWRQARIVIEDLGSGDRRELDPVGHDARYVSTGHLLYVRHGDLWAVAFDFDERARVGEPVVVERGLQVFEAVAQYTVSNGGTLVFARPEPALRTLEWVRRQGAPEPIDANPDEYTSVRVSPDNRRLALTVGDGNQGPANIATLDLTRPGYMTNVTDPDDPFRDGPLVWMKHADRLVFSSVRDDTWSLFSIWPGRTDAAVALTDDTFRGEVVQSVFPDDSRAVYRRDLFRDGQFQTYDLYTISLDGENSLEPLLVGEERVMNADVSPDGQHLAFESDRDGEFEIFIVSIDDPDGDSVKVSQDGGTKPVWSPSGEELFYVRPADIDRGPNDPPRLMSVRIDMTGSRPVPQPAVPLFDVSSYYLEAVTRNFDVTGDPGDERFVFIRCIDCIAKIQVAVNWFAHLERLAPTGS